MSHAASPPPLQKTPFNQKQLLVVSTGGGCGRLIPGVSGLTSEKSRRNFPDFSDSAGERRDKLIFGSGHGRRSSLAGAEISREKKGSVFGPVCSFDVEGGEYKNEAGSVGLSFGGDGVVAGADAGVLSGDGEEVCMVNGADYDEDDGEDDYDDSDDDDDDDDDATRDCRYGQDDNEESARPKHISSSTTITDTTGTNKSERSGNINIKSNRNISNDYKDNSNGSSNGSNRGRVNSSRFSRTPIPFSLTGSSPPGVSPSPPPPRALPDNSLRNGALAKANGMSSDGVSFRAAGSGAPGGTEPLTLPPSVPRDPRCRHPNFLWKIQDETAPLLSSKNSNDTATTTTPSPGVPWAQCPQLFKALAPPPDGPGAGAIFWPSPGMNNASGVPGSLAAGGGLRRVESDSATADWSGKKMRKLQGDGGAMAG